MNKLEIDFELELTVTPELFWKKVYDWLSSTSLLAPTSCDVFVAEHKELKNFHIALHGKKDF